jgi:hypothetical protein
MRGKVLFSECVSVGCRESISRHPKESHRLTAQLIFRANYLIFLHLTRFSPFERITT